MESRGNRSHYPSSSPSNAKPYSTITSQTSFPSPYISKPGSHEQSSTSNVIIPRTTLNIDEFGDMDDDEEDGCTLMFQPPSFRSTEKSNSGSIVTSGQSSDLLQNLKRHFQASHTLERTQSPLLKQPHISTGVPVLPSKLERPKGIPESRPGLPHGNFASSHRTPRSSLNQTHDRVNTHTTPQDLPRIVPAFTPKISPSDKLLPDGSGLLKYPTPVIESFIYDPVVKLRFDPSTGLHYDANAGLFFNNILKLSLYWDKKNQTYLQSEIQSFAEELALSKASPSLVDSKTRDAVRSDPVKRIRELSRGRDDLRRGRSPSNRDDMAHRRSRPRSKDRFVRRTGRSKSRETISEVRSRPRESTRDRSRDSGRRSNSINRKSGNRSRPRNDIVDRQRSHSRSCEKDRAYSFNIQTRRENVPRPRTSSRSLERRSRIDSHMDRMNSQGGGKRDRSRSIAREADLFIKSCLDGVRYQKSPSRSRERERIYQRGRTSVDRIPGKEVRDNSLRRSYSPGGWLQRSSLDPRGSESTHRSRSNDRRTIQPIRLGRDSVGYRRSISPNIHSSNLSTRYLSRSIERKRHRSRSLSSLSWSSHDEDPNKPTSMRNDSECRIAPLNKRSLSVERHRGSSIPRTQINFSQNPLDNSKRASHGEPPSKRRDTRKSTPSKDNHEYVNDLKVIVKSKPTTSVSRSRKSSSRTRVGTDSHNVHQNVESGGKDNSSMGSRTRDCKQRKRSGSLSNRTSINHTESRHTLPGARKRDNSDISGYPRNRSSEMSSKRQKKSEYGGKPDDGKNAETIPNKGKNSRDTSRKSRDLESKNHTDCHQNISGKKKNKGKQDNSDILQNPQSSSSEITSKQQKKPEDGNNSDKMKKVGILPTKGKNNRNTTPRTSSFTNSRSPRQKPSCSKSPDRRNPKSVERKSRKCKWEANIDKKKPGEHSRIISPRKSIPQQDIVKSPSLQEKTDLPNDISQELSSLNQGLPQNLTHEKALSDDPNHKIRASKMDHGEGSPIRKQSKNHGGSSQRLDSSPIKSTCDNVKTVVEPDPSPKRSPRVVGKDDARNIILRRRQQRQSMRETNESTVCDEACTSLLVKVTNDKPDLGGTHQRDKFRLEKSEVTDPISPQELVTSESIIAPEELSLTIDSLLFNELRKAEKNSSSEMVQDSTRTILNPSENELLSSNKSNISADVLADQLSSIERHGSPEGDGQLLNPPNNLSKSLELPSIHSGELESFIVIDDELDYSCEEDDNVEPIKEPCKLAIDNFDDVTPACTAKSDVQSSDSFRDEVSTLENDSTATSTMCAVEILNENLSQRLTSECVNTSLDAAKKLSEVDIADTLNTKNPEVCGVGSPDVIPTMADIVSTDSDSKCKEIDKPDEKLPPKLEEQSNVSNLETVQKCTNIIPNNETSLITIKGEEIKDSPIIMDDSGMYDGEWCVIDEVDDDACQSEKQNQCNKAILEDLTSHNANESTDPEDADDGKSGPKTVNDLADDEWCVLDEVDDSVDTKMPPLLQDDDSVKDNNDRPMHGQHIDNKPENGKTGENDKTTVTKCADAELSDISSDEAQVGSSEKVNTSGNDKKKVTDQEQEVLSDVSSTIYYGSIEDLGALSNISSDSNEFKNERKSGLSNENVLPLEDKFDDDNIIGDLLKDDDDELLEKEGDPDPSLTVDDKSKESLAQNPSSSVGESPVAHDSVIESNKTSFSSGGIGQAVETKEIPDDENSGVKKESDSIQTKMSANEVALVKLEETEIPEEKPMNIGNVAHDIGDESSSSKTGVLVKPDETETEEKPTVKIENAALPAETTDSDCVCMSDDELEFNPVVIDLSDDKGDDLILLEQIKDDEGKYIFSSLNDLHRWLLSGPSPASESMVPHSPLPNEVSKYIERWAGVPLRILDNASKTQFRTTYNHVTAKFFPSQPTNFILVRSKVKTPRLLRSLIQTLGNQKVDYLNVMKTLSIESGAPYDHCHVIFNTAQDAMDWYSSCNGSLQVTQRKRAFLHFSLGNWKCPSCDKCNFTLRFFCFNCYTSKQGSDCSPIQFTNTPTRFIGIGQVSPKKNFLYLEFPELNSFKTLNRLIEVPDPGTQHPTGLSTFEFKTIPESTRCLVYLMRTRETKAQKRMIVSYVELRPTNAVSAKYVPAMCTNSDGLPMTTKDSTLACTSQTSYSDCESSTSSDSSITLQQPVRQPSSSRNHQIIQRPRKPDGNPKFSYPPPRYSTFRLEPLSGLLFDYETGLYYHPNTDYFYNDDLSVYLKYDKRLRTYVRIDIH